MKKIIYVDVNLQNIGTGNIIKIADHDIYQMAIIKPKLGTESKINSDNKSINAPIGYNIVDYQDLPDKTLVFIEPQTYSVRIFKETCQALQKSDHADYYIKWLLSCSLNQDIPFDFSARVNAFIGRAQD